MEAKIRTKPLQLPEELAQQRLDKAEPNTATGTRNRIVPPLGTTKCRGACYHGYPTPNTATTKDDNRMEPLQPPKKPKGLKLDKVMPRAKAGTNEMAPSLGTTERRGASYHRYPAQLI